MIVSPDLMALVRAPPPLYDEIAAQFDVKGKPILFAWGHQIYAPCGVTVVMKQVRHHEAVHGTRQLSYDGGIEGWWRKYLDDATFRLDEEKAGHRAEYQALCSMSSGRADRRRHLSHVAARLSASLYRYAITKDEARRFLEHGND